MIFCVCAICAYDIRRAVFACIPKGKTNQKIRNSYYIYLFRFIYIYIYACVCAFCACIGSSWRNDLLFSKTIHYFLSLYIHIFLLSPRLFNDVLYEMEKKYGRRQHRLECMVVWLSIVQVVVLIACRLETCKKGKTWSNLIKVFFYCKNGTISSFDHDFVLSFSLYNFMIM